MTRVSQLGISAFAFGCLLAATDGRAERGQPSPARVAGSYRFVGGEPEILAMDRAIDAAVEDLNMFIRGLARKRLREPNLPSEQLRIVAENGQIRISRTGQPEIAAPNDGEPVKWRNPDNDNTLEVRHQMLDTHTLEQRLRGDRGLSINRFVLDGEDARLRVHTVITADRLSEPLRFSTTYARLPSN